MRSMLYLLAISAGLALAAGPALADSGPAPVQLAQDQGASDGRGGSLAAGDYEPDQYDPKKHFVDRRNLGNRPVWWWTHPMCRPKLRDLGNCKLDLDEEPALETEPEVGEQGGR